MEGMEHMERTAKRDGTPGLWELFRDTGEPMGYLLCRAENGIHSAAPAEERRPGRKVKGEMKLPRSPGERSGTGTESIDNAVKIL